MRNTLNTKLSSKNHIYFECILLSIGYCLFYVTGVFLREKISALQLEKHFSCPFYLIYARARQMIIHIFIAFISQMYWKCILNFNKVKSFLVERFFIITRNVSAILNRVVFFIFIFEQTGSEMKIGLKIKFCYKIPT